MLCFLASWLATKRPSWSLPDRSNGGGFLRRSFSSARRSSLSPSPRSSISTANPRPTTSPLISTGVFGGEKMTAFSASSAIMWMTSATAGPLMAARVFAVTLIRV